MSRFWYVEALADLPRHWRENPLVALSHPRRRSIFHRAVAQMILLLFGVTAVLAILTFLTGDAVEHLSVGPSVVVGRIITIGLGLVATFAPVLMVPLFLIYCPHWRTPDRLVDIRLTSLTPRDVAVGALLWPLLMGGLVALTGVLALAGVLFSQMEDGARYIVAPASFGAYGFAAVTILSVATRLWLSNPGLGWRLLLLAPLRAMPVSFGYWLYIFPAALILWNAVRWDDRPESLLSALVVMCLAVISGIAYQWIFIRLAVRDAGARVMGLIDRDGLLRVCWSSREAAAGRLPRAARGSMMPLIRHWAGRLPALLGIGIGIFGGLLLICFMVPELHPIHSRPEERTVTWLLLFHWGTVVFGVAQSWLARRDGRLPLLSGRFGLSLLLWLPTGMVAVVGVLAVLVFGDQSSINRHQPLSWMPYAIALVLFTTAVGMFALAYLVWVSSSPRPARLGVALVVGHSVIGLLVAHAIDQLDEALEIPVAMVYALIMLAPMLLLPWALDRLHRRELGDIPIGRSNIDTAADPSAPIIPDEAAEG